MALCIFNMEVISSLYCDSIDGIFMQYRTRKNICIRIWSWWTVPVCWITSYYFWSMFFFFFKITLIKLCRAYFRAFPLFPKTFYCHNFQNLWSYFNTKVNHFKGNHFTLHCSYELSCEYEYRLYIYNFTFP